MSDVFVGEGSILQLFKSKCWVSFNSFRSLSAVVNEIYSCKFCEFALEICISSSTLDFKNNCSGISRLFIDCYIKTGYIFYSKKIKIKTVNERNTCHIKYFKT